MILEPYTPADEALTHSIECDPRMMGELGGPMHPDDIPNIHARRMAFIERGAWYFKLMVDGEAAGTVGLWETTWQKTRVHEMGWMVRPEFQGRGLAHQAVEILLQRARSDPGMTLVVAFPGVTNGASNAICRKAGFQLRGQCDIDYAGRTLRCNYWALDVSDAGGA